MTSAAYIVLAAGMGTRMKSSVPKVLHKIAGCSMLAHVLSTVQTVQPEHVVVVVGPDMDAVSEEALNTVPTAKIAVQENRLGTADAVRAALPALAGFDGPVLVLFGDTPLIRPVTLEDMRNQITDGADLAVLGFEAADPAGYGRLLRDGSGTLTAIREEADASPAEREVTLCNSGVMSFGAKSLNRLIAQIDNKNSQQEFYLTDAVELASAASLKLVVAQCGEDDVMGINTRAQLAEAEAITQNRLRQDAMVNGATLVAPETTFLSADTCLGRDVIVEPHVVFGPGVVVEDGAHIFSFSHMDHCIIRQNALIGPYARLRPGADIGVGSKVGNFVEVKKAVLEKGSKVNHLTYIGDARVGEKANVGAGTITCNYDGSAKHHTDIGAGAFIGSNSSLIAPVKIGAGAYIGSGSVVTKDVQPDALAVSRPKQVEIENWASRKLDGARKKSDQ
ncbi:MAG: bifunctional UDP-N-acetylglucosamine diphosphorylase/glucosamine-1-phosphate N-acetyltransferase GlmU [Rhodobacteraceae bacterium]|nr:bifunctional UDP-N-acetylglucosamine diphosphorylase/glucosamine-1-phosphate N-acetyltransferase GlmU [Paracoccaceae bacterium]